MALDPFTSLIDRVTAGATKGKGGKMFTPGTSTGMTYIQPKTGKRAPAQELLGHQKLITPNKRAAASTVLGGPVQHSAKTAKAAQAPSTPKKKDSAWSIPFPKSIDFQSHKDYGGGWTLPGVNIGMGSVSLDKPGMSWNPQWKRVEGGGYSGYRPSLGLDPETGFIGDFADAIGVDSAAKMAQANPVAQAVLQSMNRSNRPQAVNPLTGDIEPISWTDPIEAGLLVGGVATTAAKMAGKQALKKGAKPAAQKLLGPGPKAPARPSTSAAPPPAPVPVARRLPPVRDPNAVPMGPIGWSTPPPAQALLNRAPAFGKPSPWYSGQYIPRASQPTAMEAWMAQYGAPAAMNEAQWAAHMARTGGRGAPWGTTINPGWGKTTTTQLPSTMPGSAALW